MKQKKSVSNPKSGSLKSLRIGVLLGGDSAERKISLKSGRAVRKALEEMGYETRAIDPSRRADLLSTDVIDVAFVALHGRGGEDGVLQAILDQKKIPYTGSGPRGCRLSFDKVKAKAILRKKGIPTADYAVIDGRNWMARLKRLGEPIFIKPVDDGSSIGVFAVDDLQKSANMIKTALRKYGRLLAERKISGREFTVAVLDGKALPVIELRPERSFYDYKAKYTKGLCNYLVPAPIDPKLAKRMQAIALDVHRALELEDVSRVDIMTDERGDPYVLEANAIPGLTEMSLLPKAARQSGISFGRLCEMLLEKAYSRKKKAGNPARRATVAV